MHTEQSQASTENRSVVGVFNSHDAAEQCVRDLHSAGFSKDQIGFISHERGSDDHPHAGTEHAEEEGALKGAAKGSVVGSLAGVVAGAPTGAAAGGIAGALRGAGVPEAESEQYEHEFRQGGTLVSVNAGSEADRARRVIESDGGRIEGPVSRAVSDATGTAPSEDMQTMELREERLDPRTEPVEAGRATVRKEVVTEQQELEVPVSHEEVVVERHPVDRPEERPGHQFGAGEVKVPVSEDQVQVEKRQFVTGEVDVHKQTVEGSQRVTGEVRKEVPRIETEGEPDVEEDLD